jgi:death-on-curing protein
VKGSTQYLELEDLIEIGDLLIKDFQVRDIGLLESAVKRPMTKIYGIEIYESLEEKIAVLLQSLSLNMALADGNKVLAWAAIRTFARLNQRDLKVTASRAEQLINNVIESQYDLVETSKEIKSWLKTN